MGSTVTKLEALLAEIRAVEGFDVRVSTGSEVAVIEGYPYSRALAGTKNVKQWRDGRFGSTLPDLDVDVLNGDGTVAHGRSKLSTVRETYEEAEGSAPRQEPTVPATAGSPGGLRKSKRKHVGFNSIVMSPQGQEFAGSLESHIGPFDVVAIGSVRDMHVFAAIGRIGRAVIIETKEEQHDHEWWWTVHWLSDEPALAGLSLFGRRWEPWLALDHDEVRSASRKQRAEWDAYTAELAAERDTLAPLESGGLGQVMEDLGLSESETEAVWARLEELAPLAGHSAGAPSLAEVRDALRQIVTEAFGEEAIAVDEDGLIYIGVGSAQVFIVAFDEPAVIRVGSAVVLDIQATDDASEIVHDLNRRSSLVRWVLEDNYIAVGIDLMSTPIVPSHVISACHLVGSCANDMDEQLRDRLGGRTYHETTIMPRPGRSLPGYL